jgi:hypothetical protein
VYDATHHAIEFMPRRSIVNRPVGFFIGVAAKSRAVPKKAPFAGL